MSDWLTLAIYIFIGVFGTTSTTTVGGEKASDAVMQNICQTVLACVTAEEEQVSICLRLLTSY